MKRDWLKLLQPWLLLAGVAALFVYLYWLNIYRAYRPVVTTVDLGSGWTAVNARTFYDSGGYHAELFRVSGAGARESVAAVALLPVSVGDGCIQYGTSSGPGGSSATCWVACGSAKPIPVAKECYRWRVHDGLFDVFRVDETGATVVESTLPEEPRARAFSAGTAE